jgi:hypothetical protein
MDVQPSKTYLVRFIGAQALTYLRYKLAAHNFLIVQIDGASYVKPIEVEHMEIAGGQRYAALLHTKSSEELQRDRNVLFWANISSFYREDVVEGYALVRYRLDNESALSNQGFHLPEKWRDNVPSIFKSESGWIDEKLEPLMADPFPATVDQRILSDDAYLS